MTASDALFTSIHIHAHAFLSTWHNHCRLHLFLQMLSPNKLWKKESLKRREMVKDSCAYYICMSLQELFGWAFAVYASEPVVQYHIMFVVLVHVVFLWHRCSVNPSPFQINFSPPYDMAAIHKNKSERNAFLNSLGHEKWMSRILKITYYVYIACAVDSHWNIILYIYIY